MTVELHDQEAPDATAFVLAHLAALGPCDIVREENGPLPFRHVNPIIVDTEVDEFQDSALISVHTMARTETEARREGRRTHRRMLLLAYEPVDVAMADGSIANCASLDVETGPIPVDYRDDSIHRVVARYRLGLEFVTVPQ